MTVVGGGGATRSGLVTRVKNILLSPKTEWEVIDAEPATVGGLYTGYAMILAAIPAVAALIGGQLIGVSLFGVSYKPPIIGGVVMAIVTYLFSLIGVGLLGLIIDALAPTFDGAKDRVQAFKVAIYSMTASWVGGIFGLIPMLAPLAIIVGLYGLYLLYLGLPRLMKAPEAKAMAYTVVTIVCAIVVSIVVSLVATAVTAPFLIANGMFAGAPRGDLGGKLTVPGVGSVDVGKLESAAKQMEAASKQMADAANSGQTASGAPAGAIAPDVLQGLLPAALPGYTRSEVSSASGGMGGLGGTTAKGVYNKGDSRITVEVTDLGAMAAMASAFNVNANKQTADGYEKVGKVDGRMTMEEYNRSSNHGSYGVMVADRYMVQAEGDRVTMEELKNAVTSIPYGRLEALSKG